MFRTRAPRSRHGVDDAVDAVKHRDARSTVLRDLLQEDVDIAREKLWRDDLLDHAHLGRARVFVLLHPLEQHPSDNGPRFHPIQGATSSVYELTGARLTAIAPGGRGRDSDPLR